MTEQQNSRQLLKECGKSSASDREITQGDLSKDAELARLRAEKQVLHEDLIQCKADKEFVWSLWKRLQVANPDITQAISMVLQREKEKNELKDRKVLEILHIKDDRIGELDKILTQQTETNKAAMKRIEEIEKAKTQLEKELEQKVTDIEAVAEEKEELKSETGREVAMRDDKILSLTEENKRLSQENKRLTAVLDQHREELTGIEEKNSMLMDKIKEMEKDIHGIGISAEVAAKEHSMAAVHLGQAEQDAVQWMTRAKIAEGELEKLRNKHSQLKKSYQETLDHTAQQLHVITQLQTLQAETQTMLKTQENAHLIEASNYQAVNKELQRRYEAVKKSEDTLQKLITEKNEAEEEVKVSTSEVGSQVAAEKEEEVRGQMENDNEQPWVERSSWHKQVTSTKSSLTQTDVGQHWRSHDPKLTTDHLISEEALLRKYDQSTTMTKQQEDKSHLERKVEDLQKLLLLKDEEVNQMKQAHQSRLSRLQSLQSANNILKEQIETYEENEKKPPKSKKPQQRAAPKALQRENSDAVWNELTYYKQRTADLIQEKMRLQEKFDQLQVQTAADASTLEELTQCLQEDKRELHTQMRRMKELKKHAENERKKLKNLSHEHSQLKASLLESEERQYEVNQRLEEASHETRVLKAECTRLESDLTVNQSRVEVLESKVARLKTSLIRMRKKNRILVAEREETATRKELDEKLNQTLDRMSQILTDGDEEEYTENNSQSDEDDYPPKQRLAPKMATSTPRKRSASGRRHHRSSTWTSSSREFHSVQKHLTRMARAYEEDHVGETIWKQVSTQTDADQFGGLGIVLYFRSSCKQELAKKPSLAYQSRVTPKKFLNVGVGDLDVNDETSTNASEDSRSNSPAVTNQVVDITKPLLRTKASPGIKTKSSVRNLQHRISTLQQQVTLLKEMKNALQKNQEEMKVKSERLEGDLKLATHQLQTTRQTVQRLSRELESSRTENVLVKEQLTEIELQKTEEKKIITSTKQMEDRLKTQSQEMGRQSGLIKTLREQNEEQATTIQTLQDKVKKLDKDSKQKRSLIEDLQGKARSGELGKESLKEQLEAEENTARKFKDEVTNKKIEMESLKKQLIVAKKEKENYEHRWIETKKALEKQKSLTDLSRSRQQEAEKSLNQLEALAAEQLQGLTQQSEETMKAARRELKELRSRLRDYRRDLAVEVSNETKHYQPKPQSEVVDPLLQPEKVSGIISLKLECEDWQEFTMKIMGVMTTRRTKVFKDTLIVK
ncbi:putative centlein-like [Apostichopus japonicus]|uniref:Putative centlein-like n=1 Tax=Stichopus japonicus TaxID=307972 RepID=A0A2G8LA27_STIJA|nr:putative centlein-like [Apostichopus japonicus]